MSDKKPEIVKTLAKDIKIDDTVQVPAERAKVVSIEPLNKTLPTMSKGLLKIEVVMTSGINKGNKTSFVSKEDDKLDVVPKLSSWGDYIKGALGTILVLAVVGLCYALFQNVRVI